MPYNYLICPLFVVLLLKTMTALLGVDESGPFGYQEALVNVNASVGIVVTGSSTLETKMQSEPI